MNVLPLQAVDSQSFLTTLGGLNVQINVYQKNSGLFVDVYPPQSSTPIIAGVLAQNQRLIVLSAYLGFVGDLMFIDNLGSSDPSSDGLGTRYSLMYLSPSDIPSNSIVTWAGMT